MVDFFNMTGFFVVIFDGEGAGAKLKVSPHDVLLLLLSDEGCGFGDVATVSEVKDWLTDGNGWNYNDDGRPYRWGMPVGDIGHVTVVRIDPPIATGRDVESCCDSTSVQPVPNSNEGDDA